MGLPLSLTVGAVAFILGVIWGGPLVEILRRLKAGKNIRAEIGDLHQKKAGTPTMGGILIVVPVIIITLALNIAGIVRGNAITGPSILLPLFVLISFAALGAFDDWQGFRRSRGEARY